MRVKSRGKDYFYLRRSHKVKNKLGKPMVSISNIFAFGTKDRAIEALNEWIKDKNNVPLEIKERGFDIDDFKKWLKKIERY